MRRFAAIAIVCAVAVGAVSAQDVATATDGERVQNCLVDDPLPQEPATAEQGGFLFEYQSFRGETEDGRVCTVYRLRNAPDKPPTPFRWTLGEEPIVDKARLGRCGADQPSCPWTVFVKYFAGRIDTNLSTLSYGLNADAFHEQATTYLSHASVEDPASARALGVEASSVGTEIVGTFEDAEGEPLDVHLLVKSRFEPSPDGGVFLIYEIDDLSGDGVLTSDELRVAWDALAAIGPVARLLAQADDTGASEASIDGVGSLTRTSDALAVAIRATGFVLDQSFGFRVFVGEDPEPAVAVRMGAYVPATGAP